MQTELNCPATAPAVEARHVATSGLMACVQLAGTRTKMNFMFSRAAGVLSAAVMLVVIACGTTRYDRAVGEVADDKTLNRRVSHALSGQPVYKFPDVHVQTFRGVVRLNGFVASEAQRQAAEEIARGVRGVGEVNNAIAIAPLAQENVSTYLPGRTSDTNEMNRATGAPAGTTGTTKGTQVP